MPNILDFEKAVKATDGEDRALLIGNGFSANYFDYRTLLDQSGLADGSPLRNLFSALNTADFELVINALEGAVVVERAYGNVARADELYQHAQKVREALVKAVNSTHPKHRDELGAQYASSAAFLSHFSTVFSLNYDLLLYWVNLEKRVLKDGFGLGDRCGKFIGPFSEDAYCNLYNLHGGLHLFDDGAGEIFKAVDEGSGVVATITETIAKGHRLPVYVAEGTSQQKMRKINSVEYLRGCFNLLKQNAATLFIYGHSADENDAHIYRAIFASKTRHVYFGVYQPDPGKLKMLDGLLAKYQKSAGSEAEYTFFDSDSAKVWSP